MKSKLSLCCVLLCLAGCVQNESKPVPAAVPAPGSTMELPSSFLTSYAKQLAPGWICRWLYGAPLTVDQWTSDPFLRAQLSGRVPASALLYPVRFRFSQTQEGEIKDKILDVYFYRDLFGEWVEALSISNPVSTFR